MHVFITFEGDGCGGERIERVFCDISDAQNWIIKTRFRNNSYYNGHSQVELEEFADSFIEEHDVE